MVELTEKELMAKQTEAEPSLAFFFYTPLCGTCKVSERMLNIILEMNSQIPLYKCNINVMPDIAQRWEIQSAPCLIVYEKGEVTDKVYAMRSVDHLYGLLKPLIK
jgi:thioredoxin-like negative regulator of GroEL